MKFLGLSLLLAQVGAAPVPSPAPSTVGTPTAKDEDCGSNVLQKLKQPSEEKKKDQAVQGMLKLGVLPAEKVNDPQADKKPSMPSTMETCQ